MFKKLVSVVAIVGCVACSGSDGSNGVDGKPGETGAVGSTGTPGVAGEIGTTGVAGKDGTDNRFIASIRCSGVADNGPIAGHRVEYVAHVTVAGDTFATAEVQLGSFTQSAARFYSIKQIGSLTATVFIPIDNIDGLMVSVDRVTKVTTVRYSGSSSWYGTFDPSACVVQNFT